MLLHNNNIIHGNFNHNIVDEPVAFEPVTAEMNATYARLKEYWIKQSLVNATEYNATMYPYEEDIGKT